jgi:hypothetical protein
MIPAVSRAATAPIAVPDTGAMGTTIAPRKRPTAKPVVPTMSALQVPAPMVFAATYLAMVTVNPVRFQIVSEPVLSTASTLTRKTNAVLVASATERVNVSVFQRVMTRWTTVHSRLPVPVEPTANVMA